MLEFYLRSARGFARARSSLVGRYLDGFAAALRELGYCRLIGQWCITYAVHLGLWAAAEGIALGALDDACDATRPEGAHPRPLAGAAAAPRAAPCPRRPS